MTQLPTKALAAVITMLLGAVLPAAPAWGIHPGEKSETENLKRRIEVLEARQAEWLADENRPRADLDRLNRYLALHGLLEVEAGWAKDEGGAEASDIRLATAELSAEATLGAGVGGHLILLYEEGDDPGSDLAVDEAVISLAAPGTWLGQEASLHVGRLYLPFGRFNSAMVTDPLTLELGETRDTAGVVSLAGELWTFQLGVFNGEADAPGDHDTIDSLAASLTWTLGASVQFGGSYLSDLAESEIRLVQDASLYRASVAAASAFLALDCSAFSVGAEYLAALDAFAPELVAVSAELTGARPAAWNLELAWTPKEQLQLAARYERARDFQDDVQRYGGTLTYGLHEHAVVALEYLLAEPELAETGPEHLVTAQLALEY